MTARHLAIASVVAASSCRAPDIADAKRAVLAVRPGVDLEKVDVRILRPWTSVRSLLDDSSDDVSRQREQIFDAAAGSLLRFQNS